jgi:hypothetical protein
VSDVCPRCLQNPCYVSCLGPDELPPTYEELKAEVAELKLAMQEFCDRVDRGEARSRKTYARFKELLKTKEGGV